MPIRKTELLNSDPSWTCVSIAYGFWTMIYARPVNTRASAYFLSKRTLWGSRIVNLMGAWDWRQVEQILVTIAQSGCSQFSPSPTPCVLVPQDERWSSVAAMAIPAWEGVEQADESFLHIRHSAAQASGGRSHHFSGALDMGEGEK